MQSHFCSSRALPFVAMVFLLTCSHPVTPPTNTVSIVSDPTVAYNVVVNGDRRSTPVTLSAQIGTTVSLQAGDTSYFDSTRTLVGIDTRYSFRAWGDGDTTTERYVVVNRDTALRLELAAEYRVDISTMPYDVEGYLSGSGWYTESTKVALIAPAVKGYSFERWTINNLVHDSAQITSLVVASPSKVIAHYQRRFSMKVAVQRDSSILIIVDSLAGQTPLMVSRNSGAIVDLVVPSPQVFDLSSTVQGPDTRFTFSTWSDSETANPRSVCMDKDLSLSVSGLEHYRIEACSQPIGLVVIQGSGWKMAGTAQKFEAPSSPNAVFSGWEIDGQFAGTSPELVVLVDCPKKVTAKYNLDTARYCLTLDSEPHSGLVVKVDSVDHQTPFSTTVQKRGAFRIELQRTQAFDRSVHVPGEDTRYDFTSWENESISLTRNIVMLGDTVLAARTEFRNKVEVQCNPPSVAYISGSGWYSPGSKVQVVAPSISRFTFQGWKINGLDFGSEGTISLTVTEPLLIAASYRQNPTVSVQTSPKDLWVGLDDSLTFSSCTTEATYGKPFRIGIPSPQLIDFSSGIEGADTKYSFRAWSDLSSENPRVIVPVGDTTVRAEMNVEYKSVHLIDLGGQLQTTDTGWFAAGDTVVLSTKSYAGYQFRGWEVNGQASKPTHELRTAIQEPLRTVARYARASWKMVTPQAAFGRRDGAGLVSYDGKLWIIGGWEDGLLFNDVWSSVDGFSWKLETANAPWAPRHSAGYVVYDHKMWIMSGDGNDDVWWSTDGADWTQASSSPAWGKRYKPYVISFDGKIWLMGGLKCDPSDIDGYYDGQNDIWNTTDGVNWTRVVEHAPWPPRGIIHGSAVLNGKMWVVGGGLYGKPPYYQYETYLNDVWSSSDGINWTCETRSAPWIGRVHHNVEAHGNLIWVMAGHNRPYAGLLNDVWYSADGISWFELDGTQWSKRHAASTVSHNGALWIIAGYLVNDVWKLEISP